MSIVNFDYLNKLSNEQIGEIMDILVNELNARHNEEMLIADIDHLLAEIISFRKMHPNISLKYKNEDILAHDFMITDFYEKAPF